jgi:hypothetical protein
MDTPSRLTLRIFVSSPGDVPVERELAAVFVAWLQEELAHYSILVPLFWEVQPARAMDTFQSQFPEVSAMDIVVGILGARNGKRLPLDKARPDGQSHESGTVYKLFSRRDGRRTLTGEAYRALVAWNGRWPSQIRREGDRHRSGPTRACEMLKGCTARSGRPISHSIC